MIDDVKKNTGLDTSERPRAVKDIVWSTAVQHGSAKTIIEKAVNSLKVGIGSSSSDEPLIKAIHDQRSDYVDGLSKFGTSMKENLSSRYASE